MQLQCNGWQINWSFVYRLINNFISSCIIFSLICCRSSQSYQDEDISTIFLQFLQHHSVKTKHFLKKRELLTYSLCSGLLKRARAEQLVDKLTDSSYFHHDLIIKVIFQATKGRTLDCSSISNARLSCFSLFKTIVDGISLGFEPFYGEKKRKLMMVRALGTMVSIFQYFLII